MESWEAAAGVVVFVEEPTNPAAWLIDLASGCTAGAMQPGCDLLHETGHLLGMAHEQQRIDAGRFLTLNLNDDICDDGSEGTRYLDTIWSGTNFGSYDEKSTVHYGPVLGQDSTYDFTRRDGTVNGLGSQHVITEGDVSHIHEQQARFFGWDRFRSRATAIGAGPLVTQLAAGVTLKAGGQIAAARVRSVDLALVFGTNDRVYMSTRGTRSSDWRLAWTAANAIAATTVGGTQLVRARATGSSLFVERTTNAGALVDSQPAGSNGYIDALSWQSAIDWGLPVAGTTVTGLALASLSATELAVVARLSNAELWIRRTTSLTSAPTGAWARIATATAPGIPSAAAFGGQVRVYYTTVSGATTTLRQIACGASSCGAATTVTTVAPGTAAAAAASETELHLVLRSADGRVRWRRYDVAGSFQPIGGVLAAQPAVTNAFQDRFGSFAVFAELDDGNLWQKGYNRYFNGRLSNLPANDYDRDARTDFVIVRNNTYHIAFSSGLPNTSFTLADSGAVLLPGADYDGEGSSDAMVFRRSDATWSGVNTERWQTATGAPTNIRAGVTVGPSQFGEPTDRPVPGDYDGDWIMDEAIFRLRDGTWYATRSSGGGDLVIPFGVATDRMVQGDYDGDGKTDAAVFRPSNGTWYVHPSGGGPDLVQAFGTATDRLVPADYDADGRTDFAFYRPSTGVWHIKLRTGEPDLTIPFGESTDRVVPGDYDGDGRADIAVFRPREGKWYVNLRDDGPHIVRTFGVSSDRLPWPEHTEASSTAINDLDGDRKTDFVIVRSNTWWVRRSDGGGDISTTLGTSSDLLLPASNSANDGSLELSAYRSSTGNWLYKTLRREGTTATVPTVQHATTGDIPVPGDYDGDALVDEAVFRPSTGAWIVRPSAGGANISVTFGVSTDRPVPSDYDGDGRTDPAVFRPSNTTWYVRPSGGGGDLVQAWGSSTDRLVPADYDGDRRADHAVFEPSTGYWRLRLSATGTAHVIGFGVASDKLVPGDFDGDGRADPAVYRPGDGTWYSTSSAGFGDVVMGFGVSTDRVPWPPHVGN